MSGSFVILWTVAHEVLFPRDFPGKNTVVGCHFLLEGIFPLRDPTWVSCIVRQILYHWATRETCRVGYSWSDIFLSSMQSMVLSIFQKRKEEFYQEGRKSTLSCSQVAVNADQPLNTLVLQWGRRTAPDPTAHQFLVSKTWPRLAT